MVRLSSSDVLYLKNTSFLPGRLLWCLNAAEAVSNGTYLLRVSPAVAEEFRDVFTERLAKVGFNSNYELTHEGKLLAACRA
jgi:hypothetical protein